MFDELLREIEHGHFINKAVSKGWYPELLFEKVGDNLKTLIEGLEKHEALEGNGPIELPVQKALVLSREKFQDYLPADYCIPLNSADETLLNEKIAERFDEKWKIPWIRRDAKLVKTIKGLIAKNEEPYQRIYLRKKWSDIASPHYHSVFLWGELTSIGWETCQDELVDELSPVSGIEALRGNCDQAIDLLESAIDDGYVGWDSRKNILVNRIGQIYLLKGDFIRAECTFKELSRRVRWYIEGNHGAVYYNHQLALVLLNNGFPDKAEKAFEKVAENLPPPIVGEYKTNYTKLLGMYRKKS